MQEYTFIFALTYAYCNAPVVIYPRNIVAVVYMHTCIYKYAVESLP